MNKHRFKSILSVAAVMTITSLNTVFAAPAPQPLEARVANLEKRMEKPEFMEGLSDVFSFGAVIEVEAGYEKLEPKTGKSSDSSDITLATVELSIDATANEYIQGHIVLLWEEDDTEPVDLDEGYITLQYPGDVTFFANIGKLYVPFGRFESAFVSDPLTLELGETRESAAVIGVSNDWASLQVGVFNGDVDTDSDSSQIDDVVAALSLVLPEDIGGEFTAELDVSWTSNIADSDNLQDAIANQLEDKVGGVSASLVAGIKDKLTFIAEYTAAVKEFNAGELNFDNGKDAKPAAWNVELAAPLAEQWSAGVKYQGSKDGGDFLAEDSYGAVVAYNPFEFATIALEYMYGEFENKDKAHTVTAQLAVEF